MKLYTDLAVVLRSTIVTNFFSLSSIKLSMMDFTLKPLEVQEISFSGSAPVIEAVLQILPAKA